jgi:hypothetical protein
MMDEDILDQPEGVETETIELRANTVGRIEGERIQILWGGANSIKGSQVDMSTAGAVHVTGAQVNLHQSGIGVVQGNEVALDQSSGAVVLADQLAGTESRIGLALARNATLNHSSSFIFLAGEVNGDVDTVLDQRAAISIGVAAGLVISSFLLLGGFLRKLAR